MTTSDWMLLGLSVPAGTVLGVFFFGGLHWTVRKGLSSRSPALWFLASLVLRTVVTLLGFYFVSGGNVPRLAACMLGFVLSRLIIERNVCAPHQTQANKET